MKTATLSLLSTAGIGAAIAFSILTGSTADEAQAGVETGQDAIISTLSDGDSEREFVKFNR